jgi:hypothetical protein
MNKTNRVILAVLEAFSVIALFVVSVAFLIAFNYGRSELVIVAIYVCLALGTDVIAVGHILIVQEATTGRAPVWLVVFTYSKLCQSVAYTGISLFVVSNILGVELPYGGQLAAALVSCAAAGAVLTAAMFIVLWISSVGFGYRIRPWPWQVVRDIARPKYAPPGVRARAKVRDQQADQKDT